MTVSQVLVATDFSASAEQALDYAVALAVPLQAHVILLHVLSISAIAWGTGDVAVALPATYFEELETIAQQSMQQALQRVRQAGLDGEVMVVHGVPFDCIIAVAYDRNVDLIVMGTHGRTGLPHVLLGSVAERVVRLAPCPVLGCRGGLAYPPELSPAADWRPETHRVFCYQPRHNMARVQCCGRLPGSRRASRRHRPTAEPGDAPECAPGDRMGHPGLPLLIQRLCPALRVDEQPPGTSSLHTEHGDQPIQQDRESPSRDR